MNIWIFVLLGAFVGAVVASGAIAMTVGYRQWRIRHDTTRRQRAVPVSLAVRETIAQQ
jgi:hypothetical protein